MSPYGRYPFGTMWEGQQQFLKPYVPKIPKEPEMTLSEATKIAVDSPSVTTVGEMLTVVQRRKWTEQEEHEAVIHLQHFLYGYNEDLAIAALDVLVTFNINVSWKIIREEARKHPSEEIRNRCQQELDLIGG